MKKFAHLAFAAAMVLTSSVGATTMFASPAQAMEEPWLIVTYMRNGVNVGNVQVFCSGENITYGDTENYDYMIWTYYSMCP